MAAKEEEDGRSTKATTEGLVTADLHGALQVIFRTPKDRLLSITMKMDECDRAVQLVQSMALLALGRQIDALQKLRTLEDHPIAIYLASQAKECQRRSTDITAESFQPPEPKLEMLHEMARIFRVLAQERLCKTLLCDQAYQAVLNEYKTTTTPSINLYSSTTNSCREICPSCSYLTALLEEVRQACGAEISFQVQQLVSQGPCGYAAGQHLVERSNFSYPTSLMSMPSHFSSYPSHLEISAAPTQCADTHTQLTHRENSTHGSPSHTVEVNQNSQNPQESREGDLERGAGYSISPSTDQKKDATAVGVDNTTGRPPQSSTREGSHQLVTSLSEGVEKLKIPEALPPEFSRSQSAPEMNATFWRPGDEQEVQEEVEFYAFVILNAQEDADMAEELRKKLETATSGRGATFSQEFAVAGRRTLLCLEDAIDNSAFTVLLLTRNFSSRMQEVFTDSALMNSINYEHKYNSVIPLLPSHNAMPISNLPKVLRTINPLYESNRNFAQVARRAISPEKVAQQRKKWTQEQAIRLQEKNRARNEQLWQEEHRRGQEAWELYSRQQSLPKPTPPTPPFHPPASWTGGWPPPTPHPTYPPWNPVDTFYGRPPSLHIQNAQCIMIGNDSTMTIADASVLRDDSED